MAEEQHGSFTTPLNEGSKAFSQADMATLEEMAQAEAQTGDERPEWLPEKFGTPNDLAVAYHELEAKLGGKEPAGPTVEPETSESPGAIAAPFWEEAAQSYQENGSITDEQLKTMTDAGIPREMVDTYMAGMQAIIQQQQAAVYESVGGEDEYTAMMDWAAKNLSPEDQATHNRAVDTGDVDAAKLAIRGLHAQYKQSTAGGPQMITAQAARYGGVEPFDDRSQVTEAIRDPRYRSSPAYRAEVERRLQASQIFEVS